MVLHHGVAFLKNPETTGYHKVVVLNKAVLVGDINLPTIEQPLGRPA